MKFGRKTKNVKTSKATSETGNTSSCKYLGEIVDSSLKFGDHTKFYGILYKARYAFSRVNVSFSVMLMQIQ